MMYMMRWVTNISAVSYEEIRQNKHRFTTGPQDVLLHHTSPQPSPFPNQSWTPTSMRNSIACINKAEIDPTVAWARASCWDVRNGDYEHQFHVISSPTVIVAPGWLIHAFNVLFRSWKEFKLATWNKCECNAPPGAVNVVLWTRLMLHIDGTGAVPLMLKFKLLTEISGGAPDNRILLGKLSEAFWWWETDDSSDFRGIIVAQRSGIIKAGILGGPINSRSLQW